MPIYEYQCVECGNFTGWAPMSQAMSPVPCPVCADPGERVLSAPNLARVNADVRKAMSRNERAAHEPKAVRRGCGCAGTHTCHSKTRTEKYIEPERKAAPALHAKTRTNARPWMLGH